ncbi:MAG: YggT family protein [Cellvibrionales bacterium]|nr:YggT family protein [Cellvibrionales bacterium]
MSSMDLAIRFLLENVFMLYIYVVLLRFLLQLAKADFYNPLSQFVVKATNPLLKPLRQVIRPVKQQDIASLVLAVFLYGVMIALIALLVYQSQLSISQLAIWSLAGTLYAITGIYLVGIIVSAIMSWIPSAQGHPAAYLLHQLVEPPVAPIRKLMPDLGGIDLSPLAVLLILNVIRIFLKPFVPL